MAAPNEPKKETVRIDLPAPPPVKSPDPNTKSRDTVRIQLPAREPLDRPSFRTSTEAEATSKPGTQDVAATQFFQPPKPPSASMPLSASVTPAPESPSSGPKKETTRIPLMPDPIAQPLATAQMKKTQPLIPIPGVATESAAIAVAPAEKSPMPLLWVLLGVSALILIIQILTYLS